MRGWFGSAARAVPWVFCAACSNTEVIGRYPGHADVGVGASADPAKYRGELLLSEGFEDASLGERDWYDFSGLELTQEEPLNGRSSFFCQFEVGRVDCVGGRPGRHLFEPQEAVFASYWVRYSDDHRASGELYFLSTEDPPVIGTIFSHLALAVGQSEGFPLVSSEDGPNVDPGCVEFPSGDVAGCDGGALSDYDFGEARSVSGCNGVSGDPSEVSCSEEPQTASGYVSRRQWVAVRQGFSLEPGRRYKGAWHLVELYVRLNTIQGGKGMADGAFRYWLDGELFLARDSLIWRTAQYPELKFNQLLIVPWVDPGNSVPQRLWIDELVLRQGR